MQMTHRVRTATEAPSATINKRLFVLICLPLIAMGLMVWSGTAAAQVARVLDTKGTALVERSGQMPRLLGAGEQLSERDVINVARDSWAILEFNDQTRITLRPNTVFRLDNYRDHAPETMLVGLVKGGLRVVTGLFGKRNPSGVKFQTATATIGIRGTEFDARLCEADCAEEERARPAPQPQPQVVARVMEMKGVAAAGRTGGNARLLAVGAALYEGDGIATGSGGYAVLLFRDGGRITLGSDSRLALPLFRFDDDRRSGRAALVHSDGVARVQTGAIAKQGPEHYRFFSPLGEIRPHGSGWDSVRQVVESAANTANDTGQQNAEETRRKAEEAARIAADAAKKAEEAARNAAEANRPSEPKTLAVPAPSGTSKSATTTLVAGGPSVTVTVSASAGGVSASASGPGGTAASTSASSDGRASGSLAGGGQSATLSVDGQVAVKTIVDGTNSTVNSHAQTAGSIVEGARNDGASGAGRAAGEAVGRGAGAAAGMVIGAAQGTAQGAKEGGAAGAVEGAKRGYADGKDQGGTTGRYVGGGLGEFPVTIVDEVGDKAAANHRKRVNTAQAVAEAGRAEGASGASREAGGRVGEHVGETIGLVVGTTKGAAEGAAQGASEGAAGRSDLDAIDHAIWGAGQGAVEGAKRGYADGKDQGGTTGRYVGRGLGELPSRAVAEESVSAANDVLQRLGGDSQSPPRKGNESQGSTQPATTAGPTISTASARGSDASFVTVWEGAVEIPGVGLIGRGQYVRTVSFATNRPPFDLDRIPRPDLVKIDPDVFKGTDKSIAHGLYVWVRDGAVQVTKDDKSVDVPAGNAAVATKDKITLLDVVPNFLRFDQTPRPAPSGGATVIDTFRARDGAILNMCTIR